MNAVKKSAKNEYFFGQICKLFQSHLMHRLHPFGFLDLMQLFFPLLDLQHIGSEFAAVVISKSLLSLKYPCLRVE